MESTAASNGRDALTELGQSRDLSATDRGVNSKARRCGRHSFVVVTARVAMTGLVVTFLCWRLSSVVDTEAIVALLNGVGAGLWLVLIPALCALGADTAGLAVCCRVPLSLGLLLKVLPARIGGDSVSNAIPGGAALAEPLRSILLSRSLNSGVDEGLATCLMAKITMAGAQVLFLAGVALTIQLEKASDNLGEILPGSDFSVIPVALLIGVSCVLLVLLCSGKLPLSLQGLISRLPPGRTRAVLQEKVAVVKAALGHVRRTARESRTKVAGSVAFFLMGWVLAGIESYTILSLLGADISIVDGLLLEGTISLMRIGFFFLPSAVGAADLAYISLITFLGVPDPLTVSVAFIALKRSREMIWIAAGFLVLAIRGWRGGKMLHEG